MEKLFWSIAFPGFGQLLNGKYIKGILFISLEFLINVQANFNEIILLSFQGDIQTAIVKTNYQWLMFYPCLYFFAIWDAYRDSGGGQSPYSFLPFVFSAYFVTIGVMYSSNLSLFGILWGPVWLPILFLFPGITFGILAKLLMIHLKTKY
ncbi:hypothetical protein [Terrihalobacillus insolitus]|uniref:hypothetical protein n=1 Tax=Terrihalobacillus insolitus TaxID=2950438 RepID=UPI0023423ADC|nr:hypothetical protein [Terrihalobacillus insolitus]MDC3412933.1 hypothetical protein [Terrihalobacillus insolitus]